MISYWQYLLTVPMFNYWILGFLIFAFVFHIGVSLKFASSVKDNTRLIPLEYGVWISNAVQAIALSTGTQSVASSRDDDTQTLLTKWRFNLWTGLFLDYPLFTLQIINSYLLG